MKFCLLVLNMIGFDYDDYNESNETHVFAGPLNPGEGLIVQYLSKCWRWCFES